MSGFHGSVVPTATWPSTEMVQQAAGHVIQQGSQCDQVDGNSKQPSSVSSGFPESSLPTSTHFHHHHYGHQQQTTTSALYVDTTTTKNEAYLAETSLYPPYGKVISPGGSRLAAIGPDQRRILSAPYPPRSPQRSSAVQSRPLRSPKRTISFDFPNDMDPRRMQEIHRQVVQMAQEAGTRDSVKIVEEHQQDEEEPIPIIHLQDPPKPKFKRQLSADNSPPDKLSTSQRSAVSTGGSDQAKQGLLIADTSGTRSDQALAGSSNLSARNPWHDMSAPMSPKRLKSQHIEVARTPPKSPVVQQLTKEVAKTSLNRKDVQLSTKSPSAKQRRESDVVHIFPQLEKGRSAKEDKNSSTMKRDMQDPSSQQRATGSRNNDETDSKRVDDHGNTSSADVVSILNVRPSPSPKTSSLAKTSSPHKAVLETGSNPQNSMQALQMLFRMKDENTDSKEERSSSMATISGVDPQMVDSELMSKPLTSMKTTLENSSEATVQTSESDVHKESEEDQSLSQKILEPNQMCSNALSSTDPEASRFNSNRNSNQTIESDPYLAELNCQLEDMKRRIFSPHELSVSSVMHGPCAGPKRESASELNVQHSSPGCSTDVLRDDVSMMPGHSQALDRDIASHASVLKQASNPSLPSTYTAAPNSTALQKEEEESRTARLCQSRVNPFKFTSVDIEKARGALSRSETFPQISVQTERQADIKPSSMGFEETSPRIDAENTGKFRLGQLWLQKFGNNQGKPHPQQRQLSDPGTVHYRQIPKTVVEKVKTTTLRQFSEPSRPPSQNSQQDTIAKEACRNPNDSTQSLQQSVRFHMESPCNLEVTEGRTALFVGENVKGTNSMFGRNVSARQDLVQSPFSAVERSSMEGCEVDRNYQPFLDPLPRGEHYDRGQNNQQYYSQPSLQPADGEYSGMSPRWRQFAAFQGYAQDDRPSACLKQAADDDSVFEDTDRIGFLFKNPLTPADCARLPMGRSSDRSSGSILSGDDSPKRPALRSQSNVEQSPNKAELEAMAQYKFLRSFSEHILDPQRLMEQLRALSSPSYEQLIDRLQDMRRGGIATSCSSDTASERGSVTSSDRQRGARRALFPEITEVRQSPHSSVDWQQGQGFKTYPARRRSFGSASRLRRTMSWMPDRDGAGSSGQHAARQPGDLDVKLECSHAIAAVPDSYDTRPVSNPRSEIVRMKLRIESYIQQILANQLSHRPSFTSQADMDQWMAQAADIEKLTREASELINSLSDHNRNVYDVLNGSVIIKVNCTTLLGVLDLWEQYESGSLQRKVGEVFGGQKMLALTGIKDVELRVSLCYLQYTSCLQELGASLLQSPAPRSGRGKCHFGTETANKVCGERSNTHTEKTISNSAPLVSPFSDVPGLEVKDVAVSPTIVPSLLSPSSPSKRSMFTYSDRSTRKAFSELNLSDGELTPTSPSTKKTFFDSVHKDNSKLSPLASPLIQQSPITKKKSIFFDIMNENCEHFT